MLAAALRAASRLPLACLYPVGRLLGPTALALAPSRRRVAERNLAHAFPEADAPALARRFYRAFGDVAMEMLRLFSMGEAELRARVRLEGAEALEEESGALLLMAHHGNLLWALAALAADRRGPMSLVYKPPHWPPLHGLMQTLGARFGVTLVPVATSMRHVLRCRRDPRLLVLVADQRPGPAERREVGFCGRPTAFFAGPDRIARRLDWPVYYLSCQRLARGRYLCRVEKLALPPHDAEEPGVVARYAARLEEDVRQAPEDWLWFHRRWWKHERDWKREDRAP